MITLVLYLRRASATQRLEDHGPNPPKAVKKAVILHTLGVQVRSAQSMHSSPRYTINLSMEKTCPASVPPTTISTFNIHNHKHSHHLREAALVGKHIKSLGLRLRYRYHRVVRHYHHPHPSSRACLIGIYGSRCGNGTVATAPPAMDCFALPRRSAYCDIFADGDRERFPVFGSNDNVDAVA